MKAKRATAITILAVLAVMADPSASPAQFRRVVPVHPVVPTVWGPRFFPVPVVNFDAGSYLHGAASVINAQGQYLRDVQEAFLMREQVRQAQIENRRRVFEQHQFEQANTPTLEEQREFRRQQEFWRSWNDPPLTEIWSGQALNNLLRGIQNARTEYHFQGSHVPLDPETVRRINVTSGRSGSIGVFRPGEELRWPTPLLSDTFEKDRTTIDKLARKVVDQVASGKSDMQSLDELTRANASLRQHLREHSRIMSSTDYIQSLRFVNQLIDSTRALQGPGAASFFADWKLTASDVSALIDQMTQKGLQFGRVALGHEAYYTALHRALVDYAAELPMESLRELRSQFYRVENP
jgi:hypothetical protein